MAFTTLRQMHQPRFNLVPNEVGPSAQSATQTESSELKISEPTKIENTPSSEFPDVNAPTPKSEQAKSEVTALGALSAVGTMGATDPRTGLGEKECESSISPITNEESSNGRTAVSDAADLGSSPGSSTKKKGHRPRY